MTYTKSVGLAVALGVTVAAGCSSNVMPGSSWNATGVGGQSGVICQNYYASSTRTSFWQQLSPSGSIPQVRYGASSAYDTGHDSLFVFGGTDKASAYNDVRVLNNASGNGGTPTWTTRQVTGTPPTPRSFALMAYNATQDTLFVFGGIDGNNQIRADLWELSNASATNGTSTWSTVAISGAAPSPIRGQMSGVYNDKNDTLVFFGGINCAPTLCTSLSDTYAITGLSSQPTWSLLASTGGAPPGRFFHSSVYDATNDRMVIFGGNAATSPNGDATASFDDVWILSNATKGAVSWRQVIATNSPGPGALMGQSAVYDGVNDRMIVYGGVNTSNYVTTATWILAGVTQSTPKWLEYDTGMPSPKARTLHSAAYTGPATNRMIVFGGSVGGGNYTNDTWILKNANAHAGTAVAKVTITAASKTVCTTNAIQLIVTAVDAGGNEVQGVIFQWKSSDTSIATVDAEGYVTAIAVGTVTITVTDESGTITNSYEVTVTPSTSIVKNPPSDAGTTPDCTCYCGWPANQVCKSNADCPPDTSEPGTYVPGACGCPIGC